MENFLIFTVSLIVYMIPTLIASHRGYRNMTPLAICNFFFGWTFVGWIGCLAWSFADNK